jgi:hypothetical protein
MRTFSLTYSPASAQSITCPKLDNAASLYDEKGTRRADAGLAQDWQEQEAQRTLEDHEGALP